MGSKDLISGSLNVCFPAPRTATGTGETFPVFKDIFAAQTPGRQYDKSLPFCRHRSGNMWEMFINLLLPDPKLLRDLNGAHRPFAQAVHDLFTNRSHPTNPVRFLTRKIPCYSPSPEYPLTTTLFNQHKAEIVLWVGIILYYINGKAMLYCSCIYINATCFHRRPCFIRISAPFVKRTIGTQPARPRP